MNLCKYLALFMVVATPSATAQCYDYHRPSWHHGYSWDEYHYRRYDTPYRYYYHTYVPHRYYRYDWDE